MKKHIPIYLILFRLLTGPAMIIIALLYADKARIFLLTLLTLGLLSDIFDGIIARSIGISNEKLRRMDSQTDLVFWVCAGVCAWLLDPEIISMHKWAVIIIFIMEGLTYLFSILKFGKETCTHAFLSKCWGLTLFAAFAGLIGFGYAGVTFYLAIIFGVIGHLDVYLIILFLPKWKHDVPSCYHAWLIRKGRAIKRHKWLNG